MGIKNNKVIYSVGHKINLFRLKFRVIPYTFRYIFADRVKLHKNQPESKTKYLILQAAEHTGLMTHMLAALGWIQYALENGYILIIDTSGENNLYQSGKSNTWEMFYEQPMFSKSVDDKVVREIISNENYAIAHNKTRYNLTYVRMVPRWITKVFSPTIPFSEANDFIKKPAEQVKWEKLYSEYIHLQPEIEQYVLDDYNRVLLNRGKVLGVLVRGAGYRKEKPYMHFIQPEMEDLIAKIDEFQKVYQWDYIYLATEEEQYETLLKEQYPDKILTNKRSYQENEQAIPGFTAGLEYLSSMYILSKCNMLIAGLCGGSQAAVLMNQHQYEHVYLFDIGKYQ